MTGASGSRVSLQPKSLGTGQQLMGLPASMAGGSDQSYVMVVYLGLLCIAVWHAAAQAYHITYKPSQLTETAS